MSLPFSHGHSHSKQTDTQTSVTKTSAEQWRGSFRQFVFMCMICNVSIEIVCVGIRSESHQICHCLMHSFGTIPRTGREALVGQGHKGFAQIKKQ